MVSNGKNRHAERKESEDFDDISEAECLCKEDKRVHRLREHENGGDGKPYSPPPKTKKPNTTSLLGSPV